MIPRYRRILVTTDFSKLGNRAIPHAYALLGPSGGTVVLCHVLERELLPGPLYPHYTPEPMMTPAERRALAREQEGRLRRLIPKRLPRSARTEVRVVDSPSPVHEAIRRLSEGLRVDVLVMGSHGRSGLARAFLGSTTERVLRISSRPVLVVRS